MRHSKSAQLETAPTKHGGESVYLFLEFTIDGKHNRWLLVHLTRRMQKKTFITFLRVL